MLISNQEVLNLKLNFLPTAGVSQGRRIYALAFYSDRLGITDIYTPEFVTRLTTPEETYFRISTANYTGVNKTVANIEWKGHFDKYYTVTSGIEPKGIIFESDHELFIQAEVRGSQPYFLL